MLLATPLTVCIVVLGKYVPKLRFLDVLLGDQPALPRHVTYYQRLLAGDREEAARVAEEYAREHEVDLAPDAVLVRALRLARRDRQQGGLSAEDEALILQATAETLKRLERIAPGSKPTTPAGAVHLPLVLGCAAHHRVEEIVIDMLALVARSAGCEVRGMPTRTLPAELEAEIARTGPAVVFIAVMPPGGLEQARYLCRRLRKRFDGLPIVVGYFGKARDFDKLLVRLRRAGASYVTTSLIQARSQVKALAGAAAPPAAHAADG